MVARFALLSFSEPFPGPLRRALASERGVGGGVPCAAASTLLTVSL